jgi:predicted PurR-regulated permease PerM
MKCDPSWWRRYSGADPSRALLITCDAWQVTEEPRPADTRLARLWKAADLRGVPLRTIIVAVVVVGLAYLAGKLVYRLRDVVLLLLVAGFVALILNPLVVVLERRVVKRRGAAVAIVTLVTVLIFLGLAVAFGYPLVGAVTHLADQLPSYVASAESGKGWIGRLARKYHVARWVSQNAPKLVTYAQDLSKPALTVGKGAVSIVIELLTIFVVVLLLLLEGPKIRASLLGIMRPSRAAELSRISAQVSSAVTGYMLGNFLTSVIAGVVVFVTLLSLNVPFAPLWALWVALVDFLPMIGGALAGIPVVLVVAFGQGVTKAVITLVVFLVYTQIENHILNPVIMSRTVRINPLLVLISVLVGASIGSWIGGLFGGFVAALLSIPAAGALQVVVREAWRITAPPPPPPPPPVQPAALADQPAAPADQEVVEEGTLERDTVEQNTVEKQTAGTLERDTVKRDTHERDSWKVTLNPSPRAGSGVTDDKVADHGGD